MKLDLWLIFLLNKYYPILSKAREEPLFIKAIHRESVDNYCYCSVLLLLFWIGNTYSSGLLLKSCTFHSNIYILDKQVSQQFWIFLTVGCYKSWSKSKNQPHHPDRGKFLKLGVQVLFNILNIVA